MPGPEPIYELGAVAVLAFIAVLVVRFLIQHSAAAEREARRIDDERIDELEARVGRLERELAAAREEAQAERHRKHSALTDRAAYLGTLKVVRLMFDQLPAGEHLPPMLTAIPRLLATAIPNTEGTPP